MMMEANNMARMSNPLRLLETKVARLEVLVKTLRKQQSVTGSRVHMFYHNQKYYLRHRSKKVDKRQKTLLSAARAIAKKMAILPNLRQAFTTASKHGQRCVLLVTPNHARKLRALAEIDLRGLLNGKKNTGIGRIRLSRKGENKYKVMG
jgi:hypothetical protein